MKNNFENIGYPKLRGTRQKCLCLLLNHTLTPWLRYIIFDMYTHVTIKGNIGYLILTSKIIQGHQRSKLYIEFIEVKTLKDSQICNFCIHTHMAHRNKIFYFNLTPAVKGGHWSSNIANWGYTIMKTLRCNFLHAYSYRF